MRKGGQGVTFKEVGVVVYTYNPNTWEAEAGGSQVPGQLGFHSKTNNNEQEEMRQWKQRSETGMMEYNLLALRTEGAWSWMWVWVGVWVWAAPPACSMGADIGI